MKKMPHECGMNVGIDPNAIRTHDLPLRRRMLYPAELRDRIRYRSQTTKDRTHDLPIR